MPFEIKIRQTGIFRTRLKIERLNTVSCVIGMHDRFQRFTDMIPSEGYLIIYDPEHIGTGGRMRYAEDETSETVLSVPGVTTKYDIELLMNLTAKAGRKPAVTAGSTSTFITRLSSSPSCHGMIR